METENLFAALGFLGAAVLLYGIFYKKTRNFINLPGLLSLFWLGGIGVASLKLSRLSAEWGFLTWTALLSFYILFLIGYYFYGFIRKYSAKGMRAPGEVCIVAQNRRLFYCVVGLTALSFGAFLLEWAILGFVPAFVKDTPHAYSTFHVTGLHYFTVSSALVPPLVTLYRIRTDRYKWIAYGCSGIGLLIPLLTVSRFFLIMSVGMVLLLVIMGRALSSPKKTMAYIGGTLLLLIPLYILLTVFRSHSVSYLNEVFEMKDPDTPIFFTQPYMYIANNYENFHVLVENLTSLKYGIRQLFPFLALTGLKFVLPAGWISTEATFVTREELTTVTILYDAYYDFGIAGVMLFGFLLGVACAWITMKLRRSSNPIMGLVYVQMAMYCILSFFTTWFSNPTTWFWFAISGIMYWYVSCHGLVKKR